jgi:hypothetical protein
MIKTGALQLKIIFLAIVATALISGCANTNFQKPTIPSENSGFYSYTHTFLTSISVQAIQLNKDGSGFSCAYVVGKSAVNKLPIKHIGDGVWASSAFGTEKIVLNSDGSVSWGSMTTFFPEKIENTNCK